MNTLAECPPAAVEIIIEFEGIDQPSKWPGASSGITIGVGYDLGWNTPDTLYTDWADHMPEPILKRLAAVCGIRGDKASALSRQFRDIRVPKEDALAVFTRATLPRFRAETARAFPGCHLLPPMVQGMLVSLVFNRGADMTGDRRREMRAIRDTIAKLAASTVTVTAAVRTIAKQVQLMTRLWPTIRGLRNRREKEASTILAAL